jgi:hypothetical protein
MKTLSLYTLLLVSALTLLRSTAEPIGTAFTYQGRLSSAGNAANGNFDIQFKLFDALTGGAQQGSTVTVPAVGVTNGLFTATVDSGSAFTGSALWLELAISPAGAGTFTPLNPRQALTAVPYASYAPSAGTAASALTANSATLASSVTPGAVSQLGASDGSPLDAVQVNANGWVGIGTNTPVAGLQISAGATNLVPTLLSELVDNMGLYTNLAGNVLVAVSGNLLALAGDTDDGVTLVDISSPATPAFRWSVQDGSGSFTNLDAIEGLALSGNLLAIASYYDHAVTLVDVTTPTAPVFLASLKDGSGPYTSLAGAYSVDVTGNLLAIAAYTDNAFTLVDITTPASPVFKIGIADGQLGFDDLRGAIALARSGNLLAIAAFEDHAVTLVDITNPSNPIRRATLKDESGGYTNLNSPWGLAFSGNLLAIAAYGDNAVTLVDVTTPTAPTLKASLKNGQGGYSLLDHASAVRFQGNLLWIGANLGLTAVDVSNPSAPVLKAVVSNGTRGFNRLSGVKSLATSGNTLVAGAWHGATLLNGAATGRAGLVSDAWVGIGTTQPAAPLHVNGNLLVENASSLLMQGPQMSIHSGKTGLRGSAKGWVPNNNLDSGESGIFIEGGTSEGGGFYADGDLAAIWSPGDGDILRVYDEDDLPNGAPKFVIDPNGRVGVLTNKPQSALHVVGNITASGLNAPGIINASGTVNASGVVQFTGSAFLNDKDLQFRTDQFHGVGWYGAGKLFAGVDLNGPALYGNGGGALGTKGSVTNIALQWDAARNVTIPGTLNASGAVQFMAGAHLNDKDLRLRNDANHGLGWYGAGKSFAGFSLDGPALYGCSGGVLGTACGTPHATLTWGNSYVDVYGNLGVTNSILADSTGKNPGELGPGLKFGGSGSGEGIASKRTAGGNQFGLDLYTGYSPRLSIDSSGRVGIGTTAPSDSMLDVRGDIRLNDCQLLLRGGTDRNHGLRWSSPGGWAPGGVGWDGPVLYGAWGGLLGTTVNGNQYSLIWNSSGNVVVRGTLGQGCDRAIKTDFGPVNPAEVLDKVAAMPLQTWRYKADGPEVRHLGPFSQDFRAAFGLGMDDKHIDVVDADGVALAAIQGLNQKVEDMKAEAQRRDAENAELKQRLERLEQLLARQTGGAR